MLLTQEVRSDREGYVGEKHCKYVGQTVLTDPIDLVETDIKRRYMHVKNMMGA